MTIVIKLRQTRCDGRETSRQTKMGWKRHDRLVIGTSTLSAQTIAVVAVAIETAPITTTIIFSRIVAAFNYSSTMRNRRPLGSLSKFVRCQHMGHLVDLLTTPLHKLCAKLPFIIVMKAHLFNNLTQSWLIA